MSEPQHGLSPQSAALLQFTMLQRIREQFERDVMRGIYWSPGMSTSDYGIDLSPPLFVKHSPGP